MLITNLSTILCTMNCMCTIFFYRFNTKYYFLSIIIRIKYTVINHCVCGDSIFRMIKHCVCGDSIFTVIKHCVFGDSIFTVIKHCLCGDSIFTVIKHCVCGDWKLLFLFFWLLIKIKTFFLKKQLYMSVAPIVFLALLSWQ